MINLNLIVYSTLTFQILFALSPLMRLGGKFPNFLLFHGTHLLQLCLLFLWSGPEKIPFDGEAA